MILTYPKEYLKHRIDIATRLYGFKNSQQYRAFQGFTTDLKKGPQFQVSYLGRKVYSQITNIDKFLIKIHLYQYLVYGLISLVILCLSIFGIMKKCGLYFANDAIYGWPSKCQFVIFYNSCRGS